MEGFHYSGIGGEFESRSQEFASIMLPPGAYILLAKASLVMRNGTRDKTFVAVLKLGDQELDSMGFDLPPDPTGDYQSNSSISLSGAGVVVTQPLRASLLIQQTNADPPNILVLEPRMSAIQVSDLHFNHPISTDAVGVEPATPSDLIVG